MNHRPPAALLPIAIAIALAIAVAGAGAGCSDDDDTAVREAPVAPATTEATATTGAPEAGGQAPDTPDEGAGDAGAGAEGDDGGQALGSGTGDVATFDTGAPVALRIDVTRLERNGDLVELAMTLTNEDDETEFEPVASFVDPELAASDVYDISGVRLIDQGERKAYLPVLDSAGVCLCTGNLFNTTIPPGDSLDLDATFGGIPDGVTTLDLDVPGISTITGLPVEG
jgi:hypothetical protein